MADNRKISLFGVYVLCTDTPFYTGGYMAKLNKDDVLKTIIKSANLYKKNLANKNFLIVSKIKNEPCKL